MNEFPCGDAMVLYMPYGIAYATLLLIGAILKTSWDR